MSLRPLNAALAKIAKEECNEDPALVESSLQHMKDWIAKQPHLRARTDDQWLIAFLRGCKFSLERTKTKLDTYYSLRTLAPEMCRIIDPDDPLVEKILNTGTFLILPKTSDEGSTRTVIVRPGAYDATKINITDVMLVSTLMNLIMIMEDDNVVVAGGRNLMDMRNVTMAHFAQMTPSQMKKMVVAGQDALPFRQKGAHHIYTPPGFETLYNIFKNFMNEKNRNRMHVHNEDLEALYKFIPKDILPVEYGGSGGTIDEIKGYWIKKIQEYAPFIREEAKYGTDENKRTTAPKTAESMFGVDGSFRQLAVD